MKFFISCCCSIRTTVFHNAHFDFIYRTFQGAFYHFYASKVVSFYLKLFKTFKMALLQRTTHWNPWNNCRTFNIELHWQKIEKLRSVTELFAFPSVAKCWQYKWIEFGQFLYQFMHDYQYETIFSIAIISGISLKLQVFRTFLSLASDSKYVQDLLVSDSHWSIYFMIYHATLQWSSDRVDASTTKATMTMQIL